MPDLTNQESLGRILFSEERITEAVARLGQEIAADYRDREPLLISVLKGGFVFMADLIRQIDRPLSVDFMAVSGYGPSASESGVVRLIKDLSEPITGRHVIIVEDIIDTGLTLNYLMQILTARQPLSMAVCALMDKSIRRIVDIPVAYKGFDLPDVFVVGYGLDYGQQFRNLPFICELNEPSGR